MSLISIFTLIFAAVAGVTGAITLWSNRSRVVIKVSLTDKETFRINIINRTKETIEIKEYGIHLSDGSDLSRESTFPATKISYRSLAPGQDFPSDWGIHSMREIINKEHAGSTVAFAYARDATLRRYPFKCRVPKHIKRII